MAFVCKGVPSIVFGHGHCFIIEAKLKLVMKITV